MNKNVEAIKILKTKQENKTIKINRKKKYKKKRKQIYCNKQQIFEKFLCWQVSKQIFGRR